MCGLVGVLSNEGYKDAIDRKSFFIQALYADALRGFDSTGFYLSPRNSKLDNPVLMKKAFPAPDFLDMNSVSKALKEFGKYKYAIGHNRAATKGGISHKTAHPFSHGDITLVHNGTLTSTIGLPDQLNFSVDSEIITHAFNKESPLDIIPELQGAFALIWHDQENDTVSIVRNEERPLAFATVENKETLLLASEYKMLDWLAHRNGMKIDTIYSLSKGKLLTFNSDNVKEYETKDVKLKKKYIAPNYGKNYYNDRQVYSKTYQKGLPSPKEDLFSGKQLLKKLGLKKECWIDFDPTSFELYNKHSVRPRYGYLTGELGDQKDNIYIKEAHEIRAVSLKEDEWFWAAPGDNHGATRIQGQIRGARFDTETKKIIVEVDKAELFDYADEDLEEEEDKLKQVETKKKEDKKKEDGSDVPRGSTDLSKKLIIGPEGIELPFLEWDLATSRGCAICGCDIDPGDAFKTGWTAGKQPVCYNCIEVHQWDCHLH